MEVQDLGQAWSHQIIAHQFLMNSRATIKGMFSHTSSGKTRIALEYMAANPQKRFLVLAHGRNFLKEQWRNVLSEAGLGHKFVGDVGAAKSQIVAAICQDQGRLTIERCGKFDCLIFDEAHQFYAQKQVKEILEQLRPKETVLLTATPYILNKDEMDTMYVSVEDGYSRGTIHRELTSRLVLTDTIEFSDSDFSAQGDVKRSRGGIVAPEGAEQAIAEILRITLQTPMTALEGHLRKTVIFCRDMASADAVTAILRARYGELVVSSHSKNDTNSDILNGFQDSPARLLVLVDRGLLGWDCPTLQHVIDMTGTMNFGILMQMLGRLMRRGEGMKSFIKVMPKNLELYGQYALGGMLALCEEEHMREYNGKFRRMRVPVAAEARGSSGERKAVGEGGGVPVIETDFANYLQFLRRGRGGSDTYERAYVTLREFLGGKERAQWTDEMLREDAKRFNGLTEWSEKSASAYMSAYNQGIHRDIARELGWEIREQRTWTNEEIREDAKRFKGLREWHTKSSRAYGAAKHRGIQRDIARELGWKIHGEVSECTKDELMADAARFYSLWEWRKKSRRAYRTAYNQGIQREIARELGWTIRGE